MNFKEHKSSHKSLFLHYKELGEQIGAWCASKVIDIDLKFLWMVDLDSLSQSLSIKNSFPAPSMSIILADSCSSSNFVLLVNWLPTSQMPTYSLFWGQIHQVEGSLHLGALTGEHFLGKVLLKGSWGNIWDHSAERFSMIIEIVNHSLSENAHVVLHLQLASWG